MKQILLLSGKAGSGKSFLGEALRNEYKEKYNKRAVCLAFADTLKMVARNVYGWDGQKDKEGRFLLQHLGTEVAQQNYKCCWVDALKAIMCGLTSEFDVFIITDARFPHEIDRLRETVVGDSWSITTIRVDGPTILSGSASNHLGEVALDDYHFDYVFENYDRDPKSFAEKVSNLIEELQKETI